MNKELYFTIHLTESEHYIVEVLIKEFCAKNEIKFNYYRKFKNGHQPGYRECKVTGDISKIKKFLKHEGIKFDNVNRKEDYKGKKIQKLFKDILIRF